jgi:hypothetical protein
LPYIVIEEQQFNMLAISFNKLKNNILERTTKKFPTYGFIILDKGRSLFVGCESPKWLCSKFETFGLGNKT